MLKKYYTVFDSAAKAYLEPFLARGRGEAIRSFSDAINTEGHPFNRHPDDYTLYEIGSFNEDTGEVKGDRHESLGNAVEFIERSSSPQLGLAN